MEFDKICDGNEVSELDSLKIWPYFRWGNAYALFDHTTEDKRSNVGGFSDYLSVVRFFLRTYAMGEYLGEADRRLLGMKHLTTEDVQHYLNRLTEAARDLDGAYSQ